MHIKFSFRFPKLIGDSGQQIPNARLLQVLEVDMADITAEMLDYDTASGAYSKLPPKGAYLLLIFQKPGGLHLFTTLRRNTPTKLAYYRGLVGEWMRVFIEN